MENTLLVGDRVVVREDHRLLPRRHRCVRDPGDWLGGGGRCPNADRSGRGLEFVGAVPTASSAGRLIKRVIGLPGEQAWCVATREGPDSVNGVALNETSYLYTESRRGAVTPSEVRFEVVGPGGPDLRDG